MELLRGRDRRERKRAEARQRIAEALLADPGGRHYGYDLWRQSRVRVGRLYLILAAFAGRGWLERRFEEPEKGRPPQAYYLVTEAGRSELPGIAWRP